MKNKACLKMNVGVLWLQRYNRKRVDSLHSLVKRSLAELKHQVHIFQAHGSQMALFISLLGKERRNSGSLSIQH